MAANEKVSYAKEHTTYGGRLFRPGEQMTGRVSDEVIRHAQEGGLVTTSQAEAERAGAEESSRRARVAEEIKTRSEKRADGE